MNEIHCIEPRQVLEQNRATGVDLIDVRTPLEFREVHASLARNFPLDRLDPKAIMAERGDRTDEPIFIICKSGTRGAKACQKFVDAGYPNVINVNGGTDAWAAAGLPVVRGKTAISLERQTRIAAGVIVLGSALLGAFVNPYWALVAAAVGGGLSLAGITNSCAMGMMLARMPWNQVPETSESCSTG